MNNYETIPTMCILVCFTNFSVASELLRIVMKTEKKPKCATWINLMQVQKKMIPTTSHLHAFMQLQLGVIYEHLYYDCPTIY